MKKQDLTKMLISYRKGEIEKEILTEAISLFVYKFPLEVYKWEEKECSDFFSYFYSSINKIINSFEVKDVPLETYLSKTLRLQIKTFAAKKLADELEIKVLSNKKFWSYDNSYNSLLNTAETKPD